MTDNPDVARLVDAMWQLLDDMRRDGTSVCLAAKAQARVAFEPFFVQFQEPLAPDLYDDWMPLDEAKRILKECEQ